jgi:hypothetical protein
VASRLGYHIIKPDKRIFFPSFSSVSRLVSFFPPPVVHKDGLARILTGHCNARRVKCPVLSGGGFPRHEARVVHSKNGLGGETSIWMIGDAWPSDNGHERQKPSFSSLIPPGEVSNQGNISIQAGWLHFSRPDPIYRISACQVVGLQHGVKKAYNRGTHCMLR